MWITTVKKFFKFLPFDYDKAELLQMKKKTIGKMLTFKEPSVIINSDMREFRIESKKPLKAVKYT